jgi:hypothetical protein
VTVSYHLQPLSKHETFQYIIHRIAIAGLGVTIKFEQSAIKQIFGYSNGVPKVINSTCDKALMAAFKLRHKHISEQVVKTVVRNLPSESKFKPILINRFHDIDQIKLIGVASLIIVLLFILVPILFQEKTFEIKLAIVRNKIPAILSSAPLQQIQPQEVSKINHAESDINWIDDSSRIQNRPSEEKNGMPGLTSRQITYSIQVGAYLILKNAQDEIGELNEKGYAARIVNFEDSEGRIWHTVRVGNYATRNAAQGDAKILSERVDIETVVLPSDKF